MEKFETKLSEKYKKKAHEELGETDENRDDKLRELKVIIFNNLGK
jgi:hypothetical protein